MLSWWGQRLPEHQSYVKWVKDNPKKSKDPRFTDLVEFLKLHEEMVSAKTPGGCSSLAHPLLAILKIKSSVESNTCLYMDAYEHMSGGRSGRDLWLR